MALIEGTNPDSWTRLGKPDGATEQLRDLFIQQAALSTNSHTRVIDGATHAGLVDNQNHAPQTSAAILQVVEAARTWQPLVSSQP